MSICPACQRHPFRDGGLVALIQRALGARWWAVGDIPEACAELVVVSRIIGIVRRFVSGSDLAGVVEIDARERQARITLQLAGSDPLRWMVIESSRLAKLSATDVVTGLGHSSAV